MTSAAGSGRPARSGDAGGPQAVVAVAEGKLRGRQAAHGVSAFLGIPYAAPPVGDLLYRAPMPAPRWDGVREVDAFGPTAPKPPYRKPFDELLFDPVVPGTDFLNLNVWTPDPGAAGLPVLVWIHGGAFRNGSNAVPWYDGTAFARDGVVLVSLNYRLGAPGFAELAGAPANRGLLDQLAALRWVRENIAAFGGDPGRITICGESAGAMSVATLLSMPQSRGLFRGAIAQSGAGHSVATAADARLVTAEVAARLGVPATAEAFAAIGVPELTAAQNAVSADLLAAPDPRRWGASVVAAGMAFLPVVDGDVLAARPIDAIAAGAGAAVPVLIGTTAEEYRFFLAPVGLLDVATPQLTAAVLAGFGWDPAIATTYAANRPAGTTGDVLAAVITDGYFRLPAIRLAETRDRDGAPTFVYEFAWRSPQLGLGACHALELPFVFDTLAAPHGAAMLGPQPPQPLADRMHAAWVAFAAHGDPGWASYDTAGRPVQVFDEPAGPVAHDPRAGERRLWDGVV